jgi:hypothetical protein
LGFAILVRPLITAGVEFGIAYAAQLLAEGLAAAGVESAAVMVPASVASAGGYVKIYMFEALTSSCAFLD